MGELVERLAFEGQGASKLYLPLGTQPVPAVIVCHEWFGLNDEIRRIAKRLTGEGFLTLAIDLFDGKSTADSGEASRLASELKTSQAMRLVQAAVDCLKGHDRCTGKVGITGFSLGGGMALAAASNVDGLSAVVPFYGLPLPKYFDAPSVTVPVQGHYARQDNSVPRDRVQAIWSELIATSSEAQLFFYEAGHAFMRESDPSVYEPEDAEVAWARLVAFLKRHLSD